MKIYVCDYSPLKIIEKLPQLEKYFSNTELKYEMYSEEGIFTVNNNKTYRMKMDMDKTEKIKNYFENCNLWIDYSNVIYDDVSQIPLDIINEAIISLIYEKDKKSKIKLVVECLYDGNILNEMKKTNKYKGLIIRDFYFCTESKTDINDLNMKEELNEFLSLLN